MSPKTVRVRAPAKINFCLHVTGQRADGYHLIDSLVGFGPAFDSIDLRQSDEPEFEVIGPEAAGLPQDGTNLAQQALSACSNAPFSLHLTKSLPIAPGIGGGSADAAAVFRALQSLQPNAVNSDAKAHIQALGADIAMCLHSIPLRAQGIGSDIKPLPNFPPLPIVLANPRIPVSTPAVFARLKSKTNPPLPSSLPIWEDASAFCDWLQDTRNDLETPAIALHPEISTTLAALTATGAKIARMSGSGATCFAIYTNQAEADQAAADLQRDHPSWWITSGLTDSTGTLAAPTTA